MGRTGEDVHTTERGEQDQELNRFFDKVDRVIDELETKGATDEDVITALRELYLAEIPKFPDEV